MKIYTKKGDKGETRMLFGDAVSKDDLAPDAYGSVDELVAALGLIRADNELPIEVQENILNSDKEKIEQNILQAIQKAHELSTTTMKERMNDLTGGLNLNLPGFDNSDS